MRGWPAVVLSNALDLVYPRDCAVCGRRYASAGDGVVCPVCREALPRIVENPCPRCGDGRGPHATGERACPSCGHRRGLVFRGAAAVCSYEQGARDLVHRLKYGRDMRIASIIGDAMAEKFLTMPWREEIGIVVPVPLHWTRHLARRFNQSALLARRIGAASGKSVHPRALRRTRRTVSQARLAGKDRVENVRGVFAVRDKESLKGQVALLVDDVMTTCATAAECSRALIRAGARRVYVAVFAR